MASLGIFLFDRTEQQGMNGIRWGEDRDTAKHPTKHRTAPTAENYLVQNDNNAKIEETLAWQALLSGFCPGSINRRIML